MTGVRRRASAAWVGVATLAVLAGPAGPPRLSASDDATRILPGYTSLAHAFDVDGDGEREVVRITSSEPWADLELEVWSFDGGTWRPIAAVPLARLAAGRDVTPGTPLALLEWHDAGRARLLLVVGEGLRTNGGAERFDLMRVVLRGHDLVLEPMAVVDDGAVEGVQAADLDADGTDELVVTEPAEPGPDVSRRLRLLRWDGERFRSESLAVVEDTVVGEPIIGETDGRPGADILLASHERAELVRVAASRSTTVERAEIVLEGHTILGVWPVAVAGGTIYLSIESGGAPSMVGVVWPAGGSPAVTFRSEEDVFGTLQPIWLGDQLLFLDSPSWRSPTGIVEDASLIGADGAVLAELPASAALERSRRWLEAAGVGAGFLGPYPYAGALPGGIGGRDALLFGGHLLIERDAGQVETRPTSSFVGTAPLGIVGPDDGWMALATLPFRLGPGSLQPTLPVEGAVRIAPTAEALQPESDDGELTVSFAGALPVPGPDGGWLASADGGFTLVVEGPVGSQVAAVVGSRVEASGTIPVGGRIELHLDPRPRRSDNVEYSAGVVRLSPTGHVHATEWRGRVLREAPALETTAETRPGAFEAVLHGRADPHATVTVDGAAVEVGTGGAFSVPVEAGLAPRDVVVRAVDPAGNETTAAVEVIGFVDYRPWPWVPIVGMATILLGAGMYVRTGRRRPVMGIDLGDATIEEIEAP